MTFLNFDEYCIDLINKCLQMRDTKGKEYAHSEDRFDNFNRLSIDLNMERLKVAYIYLGKHLDGIKSFINSGKEFSNERIEGRIVDAITYLMLIAGMIEENRLKAIKKPDGTSQFKEHYIVSEAGDISE